MFSKTFGIVVLISLFMLTSCKGQKHTATINKDGIPAMELIMQDNYSGSILEETLVIRDEKSLKYFFGKINMTRKPGLPIPEIDFTKDMLFVWCAGEGVKGIPELAFKDETKNSYVFSKGKEKKQPQSSALISPFKIYKLPISSKEIVLE